jgi:valyl-tRNA synthetase
MPYVTEEIFRTLFAAGDGSASIHRADWPTVDEALIDELAEGAGDVIVDVATAVRRYKTENQLHLSAELGRLQVAVGDQGLRQMLSQAQADIRSVTRAKRVEIRERPNEDLKMIEDTDGVAVALTA